MASDTHQLLLIKLNIDIYHDGLSALAADAGLGGVYANYLFLAAQHLKKASRALVIAVQNAPAEETE